MRFRIKFKTGLDDVLYNTEGEVVRTLRAAIDTANEIYFNEQWTVYSENNSSYQHKNYSDKNKLKHRKIRTTFRRKSKTTVARRK